MTFLIDTHYLIWAAATPWQIEPWASDLMSDLRNTVLVSAASMYEIGIKVRKKQMPEAAMFERGLPGNVGAMGYTMADLTSTMMTRAARFSAQHGDPFDRMIAAQAIELDVPLLSVDGKMDEFGVRRLRAPV